LAEPVDASDGEPALADELFAEVTGAEVAGLDTTVVDVVEHGAVVEVVVDVGIVDVVVDVGSVVDVVVEVVDEAAAVGAVDEVVVDVGAVVEVVVVDVGVLVVVVDEVVVGVEQLGVVVVVVEDEVVVVVVEDEVVVVEDEVVVVVPVFPVFVALLDSATVLAVDDARAPSPLAGDPSAMMMPSIIKPSSATALHFPNLIEPPPIRYATCLQRGACPKRDRKVNSPRPQVDR
jgi:hypothetical protein